LEFVVNNHAVALFKKKIKGYVSNKLYANIFDNLAIAIPSSEYHKDLPTLPPAIF
jgi:hypothetical protein